MLQIADEVILDPQVALVDLGDEGQLVHVLEHRALPVVHDRAVGAAIAEPVDVGERAALGDFLDREVEFLAGDEVDRARPGEAGFRLDRDLGADQADLELRVGVLQRLGDLDVAAKDGVEVCITDQLVIAGQRQHVVEPQPRRRRVDQLAAGHQRRRLRQPGRIPERADLALRLIARAGAAVEPVE